MRVLLGGRLLRGEFHEIERDVRLIADRGRHEVVVRERLNVDNETRRFVDESLDNPSPSLRSLRDIDIFIFCRSFPNEFSTCDVESIRRVNPLAPIVLIAGVFCGGEDRTGELFYGVRRFYVDDWRSYGRKEFERFMKTQGSEGLFVEFPLSTTVDLAVKRARVSSERPIETRGKVALISDDPDMLALLKELFQGVGYEPVVERFLTFDDARPRESDFTRVVVDSADLSDPSTLRLLSTIKSSFPGVPIDLLAFAPRPHERAFFERRDLWGQTRVVGKPFDVEALLNWN